MSKELRVLLSIAVMVALLASGGYFFLKREAPSAVSQMPSAEGQFKPNMLIVKLSNDMLIGPETFVAGPEDAKVTVVEYFDPECETCAKVAPYLKQVMEKYQGKVRFAFRYMNYHFNSSHAISALDAARKQGQFLAVQERLYETQHEWGEKQNSEIEKILEIATSIKGIDKAKFKKDFAAAEASGLAQKEREHGDKIGVQGTPTFYINGKKLAQLDLGLLMQEIDAALAE